MCEQWFVRNCLVREFRTVASTACLAGSTRVARVFACFNCFCSTRVARITCVINSRDTFCNSGFLGGAWVARVTGCTSDSGAADRCNRHSDGKRDRVKARSCSCLLYTSDAADE